MKIELKEATQEYITIYKLHRKEGNNLECTLREDALLDDILEQISKYAQDEYCKSLASIAINVRALDFTRCG